MKIYIVQKVTGEYESRMEELLRVFSVEQNAINFLSSQKDLDDARQSRQNANLYRQVPERKWEWTVQSGDCKDFDDDENRKTVYILYGEQPSDYVSYKIIEMELL